MHLHEEASEARAQSPTQPWGAGARQSGQENPAQEQRREAGGEGCAGPREEVLSVCPHCRPRGLDPKACAHVHSSSTRDRAGRRAGWAQSKRQGGRRTGPALHRPSPSSTRCCLLILGRAGRRPRVPGALGGTGVQQQPGSCVPNAVPSMAPQGPLTNCPLLTHQVQRPPRHPAPGLRARPAPSSALGLKVTHSGAPVAHVLPRVPGFISLLPPSLEVRLHLQ